MQADHTFPKTRTAIEHYRDVRSYSDNYSAEREAMRAVHDAFREECKALPEGWDASVSYIEWLIRQGHVTYREPE